MGRKFTLKRAAALFLSLVMTVSCMEMPAMASGTGETLGKNVAASGTVSAYALSADDDGNYTVETDITDGSEYLIVDEDDDTRWQSAMYTVDSSDTYYDPQIWIVDFGSTHTIDKIVLNWEASCASVYDVEVSEDGETWTTVASVSDGSSGEITFSFTAVTAQYVRLNLQYRSMNYGYSLYELEAYTVGSGHEELTENLALSATATASSYDGSNTADLAIDGSYDTYWQTPKFTDEGYTDSEKADQYITLEWDSEQTFDYVIIYWRGGYMKGYKLQVSNDGENWEDVCEIKDGASSEERHIYLDESDISELSDDLKTDDNMSVTAKYLRLQGVTFGAYCFEVSEIEVYDNSDVTIETVYFQQDSIKLNIDSVSGKYGYIYYSIDPTNSMYDYLVWSSSDESVATIESNGKVTGKSVGKATITAASYLNPDVYNTCEIIVAQSLDTPSITAERVNDTRSIYITWDSVEHADYYILYRITTNGSTDQVYEGTDTSYTDTNLDSGKYSYYVEAVTEEDYYVDSISSVSSTVTIPVSVESVNMDKSSYSIYVGNTTYATATIYPTTATDQTLIWESSDESVATIDSNGLITGISEGTATITVTTNDGGYSDTCTVTVSKITVASFVLNSDSEVTLDEGDTFTIEYRLLPSNATYKTITWTSDNEEVATVDSNGIVTAVSEGTAVITGTLPEGKSISITINVNKVEEEVTSLTIDKTSVTMSKGGTSKITATVTAAPDGSYLSWTSYDASVVTVDSDGNLKAVGYGTAKVEVELVGTGLTAVCTVSVPAPETTTAVSKPKKVKSLKVKKKKVAKKKAIITWKTAAGETDIAGFEIQYSTKKKFKKKVKTKTVSMKKFTKKKNRYTLKKLKKGKTYYIRVRAYKLVNGEKLYGKYRKMTKKLKFK